MIYRSEVKCYQKKYSKQYLVTLTGEHSFKKGDKVYVIFEKDFNKILKENEDFIEKVNLLDNELKNILESDVFHKGEKYDDLNEKYISLLQDLNKNKDTINNALSIITLQDRVISYYTHWGFFKRLFKRVPKEIKRISEPKLLESYKDLNE